MFGPPPARAPSDQPYHSTVPAAAGNTSFCDGTMTCRCPLCEADRAWRVARGVRARRPLPQSRRAAA